MPRSARALTIVITLLALAFLSLLLLIPLPSKPTQAGQMPLWQGGGLFVIYLATVGLLLMWGLEQRSRTQHFARRVLLRNRHQRRRYRHIHGQIAQLTAVESQLEQQRLLLEYLIDNLPYAVSVKQLDEQGVGRYIVWNKMSEVVSGIAADGAIGRTAEEIWDPASAQIFSSSDREAWQFIREVGRPVVFFTRVERFGVHYRLIKIPVSLGPDSPVYLLTLMEDLTQSIKLQQRLQQLSLLDPLTDIHNRRYFDMFLESEWHRHLRRKSSIALLFIDIDWFKQYNDSAGHQAGDQCLIQVARLLKSQIRRAGEFVARYGGEEFVVLLPNTELKGAHALARKLQSILNNRAIPHPTSPIGRVSLSIGVSAMVPTAETDQPKLIDQADQALYLAKESGRNRICTQEELTTEIRPALH